ncbi:BQ2448_6278 [Microbotryum intermedium]|uniref:BQ2448_6278 protein n=1 Tax=Microbotryum intermedium TaxID=269621 RepID=A0A238FRK1_9BASI|nr:BQ2448_6278 [Microbotryum intermedium]
MATDPVKSIAPRSCCYILTLLTCTSTYTPSALPLQPNTEFNRESIAPVPSEQRKDEQERSKNDPQVLERAGGQPDLSKGDSPGSDKKEQGFGKPKSGNNENLLDAGTSFGGDGSAEGGINADEGPNPKAPRSKL